MSHKRWTIRELLHTSTEYLRSKHIENPRLCAELLLGHALKLRRIELYMDLDRPLTQKEVDAYRSLIKRRILREPVQYILGVCGFYSIEVKVGPGVLIPRPETEVLVDAALKLIDSHIQERPVRLLDLCTGSGCIALAILKEREETVCVATDLSELALNYAMENSKNLKLEQRIELRKGDLFEPIGSQERFHIIVSNPPYVGESEWSRLQPEVKDYEPRSALVAGSEGLDLIAPIVQHAKDHLFEQGALILEISPMQGKKVLQLMETKGYKNITPLKDLSGGIRAMMGFNL